MQYFAITFHLLFVADLIQSDNKTNGFVDIRTVYHYNREPASREQATEICKKFSGWLVAFDHQKEFKEITTFYRPMPAPVSGDDVRIQVSATKNGTTVAQRWYYQWDYYFKPSKIFTIGVKLWCIVHDKLKYPLDLPNFTCLMISMDREKKWCYKNYDCNNYVPFICEKKLISQTLQFHDDNAAKNTIVASNTCEEDRYSRIGNVYYIPGTAVLRIFECNKYENSHLVYLETETEAQSLGNYLKNCSLGNTFWTGGMRVGGAFRWTEKDYFGDVTFCKDEPRHEDGYDYVVLVVTDGEHCLKTAREFDKHTVICEKEDYSI